MGGQRREYINHACSNSAKFLKNAHCASIVDRLLKMDDDVRAGLVSKGVMDDYMKAHGMTPTPRGLLALKSLRPYVDVCGGLCSDWPHITLQDGTVAVELSLFLQSEDIASDQWRAYVKNIQISTRARSGKAHMIQKVAEILDAKKVGGLNRPSNNELLDYILIIRAFFVSLGYDARNDKFKSFSALVGVVCQFAEISRLGSIKDDATVHRHANRAKVSSERFQELHVRTYGGGFFRSRSIIGNCTCGCSCTGTDAW